ncbi:MAG: hypothetical protein LKH76_04555 [Acetobacter fabarum]|uniref:hypothetical protein n=1 Tax=Acetobacter fabarum TaxID=483199 RepID=UPI00242DF67F|nr:hypothetical protein [Acetobacter fabarum]MCH4026106.1 hypothetical protein [Acetobacter fabarum]MCH4054854.1 hypothetical protein [Acetobacter fabarum]MCH4086033.1 hypothetical protein [Acetobacter fabarum]MCH4127375.1 hypothetical protein [Acetobacter fabarum]MCH4136724.1 hypothetical protein [Acetobacter fabarum]
MLCRSFLHQMVMGCLLVLAATLGLWAAHTPARAAQPAMAHTAMHMAGHSMAGTAPLHSRTPAAISCPTTTAATHHLMHHHGACCMTGNALSVVDTAVGMLPNGLLWHTRARPVFATPPTLPDRRAAPLLRPPRLHTA